MHYVKQIEEMLNEHKNIYIFEDMESLIQFINDNKDYVTNKVSYFALKYIKYHKTTFYKLMKKLIEEKTI